MHERVHRIAAGALCLFLAGCAAVTASPWATSSRPTTSARTEDSQGPNPTVVATVAASEASATPLPSGGISQEQAVRLAQEEEYNPVFVSAAAGPFAEVNAFTNLGPSWDPDRLVWAIRFEITGGEVCPLPDPISHTQVCATLGPREVMVILDYYTGEEVIAGGPVEPHLPTPSRP